VDHCAIDLGGTKSQVCLRSPDGAYAPSALRHASLPDFLRQLPLAGDLETAAEAFRIADAAKTADTSQGCGELW